MSDENCAPTSIPRNVISLRHNLENEACQSAKVLEGLCNWSHPALIALPTASRGLGVFATSLIGNHELLIVFGGRVLTTEQLALMPENLDMIVQVEEGLFFVPVDLTNLSTAERINHSCKPNAGFSGQMSIRAIRDISAGEEVCIDYATCDARESFKFECDCGSRNCRKVVTGSDWKLPEVQNNLLPWFQPFLRSRIGNNFGLTGSPPKAA